MPSRGPLLNVIEMRLEIGVGIRVRKFSVHFVKSVMSFIKRRNIGLVQGRFLEEHRWLQRRSGMTESRFLQFVFGMKENRLSMIEGFP